ncbi:MAG: hypothetical protein ABSF98_26755 [Bryobacteraceae bacterium]
MADFRKWLMAFAVITLLLGFTAVAQIQNTAPVTCTANSGAPRQIRVEGVTELVGDIVMNCTGGVPQPAGQPVPLANIRVALSQPITSRSFSPAKDAIRVAEPMLVIDEPFPTTDPFPTGIAGIPGAPTSQIGCLATGGQTTANPFLAGTVGVCDIAGKYVGVPVETYQGQYNTFQGAITNSGAYIDFLGVPVDPPGSNYQRIIRITNVRVDATHVPLGGTITATISVSGNASLTLPSPFTTVAFVYTGFTGKGVTAQNEVQCVYPGEGDNVGVTFQEGFASSFKTGLITATDAKAGGGLNSLRNDEADAGWMPQDLFGTGVNYYTESGFTPNLTAPAHPDSLADLVNQTNAPALNDGMIGDADYGTRFLITINNLQNGVDLTFPVMAGGGVGGPNLWLQLVKNANSDGTGGSWAGSPEEVAGSWTPNSGATSSFVVYEVVADDPNLTETVTVHAGVTYSAAAINLGKNIPALGKDSSTSISTITASFAPIAADTPGMSLMYKDGAVNDTTWGSLPRFIVTQSPGNAVILNPCSCNLLYPWIVSDDQLSTGLVVVNTSISPTIWPAQTTQSGTVTLWFTGVRNGQMVANENHPNPAATPAELPIEVPGGCAYAIVMGAGGGDAVNCVPVPAGNGSIGSAVWTNFVGYIIATTTFQYCHGVAYVSPMSDPLHGSYYEALQLDFPNLYRTGQIGENVGH